jgi:TonB family protein
MFQLGRIPLLFLAVFVFLFSGPELMGQPSPAAAEPKDPKELMLAAARMNNLTAPDMKPWHINATYQLFDEKGAITDEGTFEELWAGPVKFKRTFTGKSFTQTDYGTDKGVLRSGSQDDVSPLLLAIRRELVTPLISAEVVERETFVSKPIDANGLKLHCLHANLPPDNGTTSCIEADRPVLRISAWPGEHLQALHNQILDYQNHSVAGDLKVIRDGKLVLTAKVTSIQPLDPLNNADFAPSADAVLLPRRVSISAGVAVGMLQHKVAPEYPSEDRGQGVQGTVSMQALIATDGRIKELRIISGPSVLLKPALDAVRQWRYRPYLLNGSPVEVMTTINVIFALGR